MENQIVIYQNPDGHTVRCSDGQSNGVADAGPNGFVFESRKANISEHLKSIFTDQELERSEATVRNFRTVSLAP